MGTLQGTFPIFEANQILSSSHLNQVFDYLDEQERLTRANLIGIGIVCGLEIRLDSEAATIYLSKGCGITSQGYLILEPQDVALVSYRTYKLPSELDYSPLQQVSDDDLLWELFPAGEPSTTPLNSPADFLEDKAVLLFLELRKDDLHTCSPNNCNDRGIEVTATVRRLLIQTDDLKDIITAANGLGTELTFSDLEAAVLSRLNLPDIRLQRYDVPNTGPVTSNTVLAAFHEVFRSEKLVANTGAALTAAYNAFKPLVQKMYSTDPFVNFSTTFGFLDNVPTTPAEVRFLQYFYDFFDDLLSAYDEFRWKGVNLLCTCCPPDNLFPRHLMLGVLFPDSVDQPSIYRHSFLASAATSNCEKRTKDFQLLFQRLVEMINRFTHVPPLAPPSISLDNDTQIRITPSKLADVPLSDKAIPYYYLQEGNTPLYQLWNTEKSHQNRANQNLGYRSDEYTPTAPPFVLNPLRYDLEPHNFLRIEGHLGKSYRRVLRTLLGLKTRHRLPIDIIALRAGAFDENVPVDLSQEKGRFQDLETLYDTLREDLLCTLCEGVRYLYDIVIEMPNNIPTDFTLPGGTPELSLLKTHAPNYRHKQGTVGAWYEQHLGIIQPRPYIDVDQNKINDNEVLLVYCVLFAGTVLPNEEYFAHIVSIYYFTKLAEILPDSLDDLGYDDFENKYQDLMGLVRYFRSEAAQNISTELSGFIPQEDLIDHFDQVLFSCKFDPIKAAHEEYIHRIRKVKEKQFLSFFLQKYPGIQHKAGVPLGGTFIIVYHEDPAPIVTERPPFVGNIGDRLTTEIPSVATPINNAALVDAFARISDNSLFLANPDIRFVLGTFTGFIPDPNITPPTTSDEVSEIINTTVNELTNGTVIADFFLPYLCCSEGSSVQYVLPVPPLGLTVELGCTSPNGAAEAKLTPQGGSPPISYQLDDQPFQALTGTLLLSVGSHTITIRDSAGAESAPQSITVPEPLTIGEEDYTDDIEANTYTVRFAISGGTPPYTTDVGTITDNIYTSPPTNSGNTISAAITDSADCTESRDFTHTVEEPCNLPCDGQSRRCAYRLWLQQPLQMPYESYNQIDRVRFQFNKEDIDLPNADDLLQIPTGELNNDNDFNNAIGGVIKQLNEVINQVLIAKLGEEGNNRLVISYEPENADPFNLLRIEYFVCDTFNIEFNFSFARQNQKFSLTVHYTNDPEVSGNASFDGAIFIHQEFNNNTTLVPAFDCSERNQCEGTNYTPLCEGPDPKPLINIEPISDNSLQLIGNIDNLNENEIIAWIWDLLVTQPIEPLYEGQDVQVRVQDGIPSGPVRLTVITRNGCFGINIRDLG